MRLGVILFPGSSDDVVNVLQDVTDEVVETVTPDTNNLSGFSGIILPGGHAYGNALRPGALAARTPVIDAVRSFADAGGIVVGISNGFQILCEAGLLPGVLLPNPSTRFRCQTVAMRVEQGETALTSRWHPGDVIELPIAHQDGLFYAEDGVLTDLEDNDQIVFRYVTEDLAPAIAGVTNEGKNVFGILGYPERNYDLLLGNGDGKKVFESLRDYISRGIQGGNSQ